MKISPNTIWMLMTFGDKQAQEAWKQHTKNSARVIAKDGQILREGREQCFINKRWCPHCEAWFNVLASPKIHYCNLRAEYECPCCRKIMCINENGYDY